MQVTKVTILYFWAIQCTIVASKHPHIVIIMIDDVGWNDVGFHGSNQIPTPNIDALAYNGIILNRFYTQQSCTPSRSALLTGRYPMRLGMQGIPILAGENRHLPWDVVTLPEKLQELGYSTNLVGKWHLGFAYKNATPTRRGFDYHFGFWNGYISYFDHCTYGVASDMNGLDMHENFEHIPSVQGEYATDLFTNKAEEIIKSHSKNKPLFLMVSHLAAHTGIHNTQLEVPNMEEVREKFHYISDENRQKYAGMIDLLDRSVGSIVSSLAKNMLLNDTVLLLLSDNGAQTIGRYKNDGSNWPLRGLKGTMFEGGVRNIGIIYSPSLKDKGIIYNELMHITDIFPTFHALAGGDVDNLIGLDGVNHWHSLETNTASKRKELLLNIDEIYQSSALIDENGRYKLINSSSVIDIVYSGYYGEDGRCNVNPSYNITAVLESVTNVAIQSDLSKDKILKLREALDLSNCRNKTVNHSSMNCKHLCLFDLFQDPCETNNIAEELPLITDALSRNLARYWLHLKPQKELFIDPNANPIYYNNSWNTWLDK